MLDEATEKWGVRVTRVELKSIDPPRTIQEAMEQQMRADRAKRAAVLQAEGEKQSAILRAEGLRQARDPERRGRPAGERAPSRGREAGPRACGPRARPRRSSKIFSTVADTGIDASAMLGYKYLETLPLVAAGDANKLLLLPAGAAQAMGAAVGLGAAFAEGVAPTPPADPKQPRPGPADDRGDSQ